VRVDGHDANVPWFASARAMIGGIESSPPITSGMTPLADDLPKYLVRAAHVLSARTERERHVANVDQTRTALSEERVTEVEVVMRQIVGELLACFPNCRRSCRQAEVDPLEVDRGRAEVGVARGRGVRFDTWSGYPTAARGRMITASLYPRARGVQHA
jgi:hypothetical protein